MTPDITPPSLQIAWAADAHDRETAIGQFRSPDKDADNVADKVQMHHCTTASGQHRHDMFSPRKMPLLHP